MHGFVLLSTPTYALTGSQLRCHEVNLRHKITLAVL